MTIRPIPDFLKSGNKELGFPHPNPQKRMRQMIGMGEQEGPLPPFVKSSRR